MVGGILGRCGTIDRLLSPYSYLTARPGGHYIAYTQPVSVTGLWMDWSN